jgi:hypothetical protein
LHKNARVIFRRQPAVEKQGAPGGCAEAISYLNRIKGVTVKLSTPQTELPPSNQLRKEVSPGYRDTLAVTPSIQHFDFLSQRHRGVLQVLWGLAVGAWVVAVSSPARAQVIAEETFSGDKYTVGAALDGLDGGTGWAGPWSDGGSAAKITTPGFSFPGLNATGAKCSLVDVCYFRNLSTTIGPEHPTIWVAFLAQRTKGPSWQGLALYNDKKETVYIGADKDGRWSLDHPHVSAISARTLHLLVARIDHATNGDLVRLYIDPTPSKIPELNKAVVTKKGKAGEFIFNRVRIGGGKEKKTPTTAEISEIRIAETYSDAVPTVPKATGNAVLEKK